MSQPIIVGDTVRFSATVTRNGTPVDPTDLSITLTDSVGSTEYDFDSTPAVTKLDVGRYYIDITLANAGQTTVVWESSGNVVSSNTDVFTVGQIPYNVTVQVSDSATPANDVPGVVVTFVDEDGNAVCSGTTDEDGEAVVRVVAGTYTVKSSKTGYRFTPQSETITGSRTASVVGVNLQLTTSPTVNLCRLYGHLVEMSGDGAYTVEPIEVETLGAGMVSFTGVGASASDLDMRNVGVARQRRTIIPRASDGFWEVDVPRGALVRVRVGSIGLDRTFTVPDKAVLNIKDARPSPGVPTYGDNLDQNRRA